ARRGHVGSQSDGNRGDHRIDPADSRPRCQPADHRARHAGHHGALAPAGCSAPRREDRGRGPGRGLSRSTRDPSVSGRERGALVILLELRAVDVSYDDLPALRAVSLTVEDGEILSVVGANGAGKTTMLRTISGLLRPRAGEILLEQSRLDRLPCHAV